VTRYRNDQISTIAKGHRRVAYCECGATLAGSSAEEPFDAAQRHLAQRDPQLLGAMELDVVAQIAENVGRQ
jgi:hypothetical protein